MPELEIIQHPQIEGLHLFLNTVSHRTLHVHPEWELLWALDKPLNVICDKQAHRIAPGQIVLFSPNQPHSFCKTEAVTVLFYAYRCRRSGSPPLRHFLQTAYTPQNFSLGKNSFSFGARCSQCCAPTWNALPVMS